MNAQKHAAERLPPLHLCRVLPAWRGFLQMTLTADLSRSEQAMARASGLASQRCVFVQDASQHLPRVKTADLASGTLFGSSEGTDDRYDFER